MGRESSKWESAIEGLHSAHADADVERKSNLDGECNKPTRRLRSKINIELD